MDIILKEWFKNKKALVCIIVSMIVTGIYSMLNSYLIIKFKDIFDNITVMNIVYIGCIYVVIVLIKPLTYIIERYAIHNQRTKMWHGWNEIVLNADFNMFTKYSVSTIYTVSNFINSCALAMKHLLAVSKCGIVILATLWGIYILGGKYAIIITIIIYGITPVIYKCILVKYKEISKTAYHLKKKRDQLQENIVYGFSEVRLFGMQKSSLFEMKDVIDKTYEMAMKRCLCTAKFGFMFEFINGAGVTAMIIYCANQIKNGNMTSGVAISLILYVLRIIDPLSMIMDIIDGFSESVPGAKDYKEISNYINTLKTGDVQIEDFNDEIKISNMSFKYNKSSSILKNIDMTIKKGQKIGIVGASGNGKSTLAKLLLHFYDPTEGSITIDGVDIRDITDESFRNIVGSVQQENSIFPGSILSNITYGSEGILENEIIEACKKADIYDFIISLPDKFETEVGPRGLELSGGQKQRIALARVFLKNPKIIILDEATSALDNGKEAVVQNAINKLDENSTVITIAHRLTTVRDCDVIYVIDKHKIAEYGNHDELINAKGIYYKMNMK